jgi:glycosyltransferase involved in cell wall biosynthesis
MKIAQIVCVLPPFTGGMGKVACQYAENLAKLGHQVDVIIPRQKKLAAHDKCNFKVVEMRPWFRIGNGAFMPQIAWKLKDYDIVHLHFPFFGVAFFVYLLKKIKKNKLKFIITYHMDVLGSGYHGLKRWFFKFYNHCVLPAIVKAADKVIVSSYDYIENSNAAKLYGKFPEKFLAIPFGVADNFSAQKKNPSLMRKYGIQPSDMVVGFVGVLDSAHYFKGVNYLLTAVSKIDNCSLKALIVGDGNLKKDFEALAEKLGVAQRVIFAGYVEEDLLAEHYNLMDLFVLPSIDKSEAFGLVLIEAMACGKPLIASNLKGVRSVVIPGDNGFLVEPANAVDISAKIEYLIKDEKLRHQFSLNGLRIVREKYRWPVVAQRLEEVYKKALK